MCRCGICTQEEAQLAAAGGGGGDEIPYNSNPEYHRVRAQLSSAVAPGSGASAVAALALPRGERFDVAVASEVLYEMHAALALPAVLAARLRPRGRFVTLMAVRDEEMLRVFVRGLCAAGARVALLPVQDMPALPEEPAWRAGSGGSGDDHSPLAGGSWQDEAGALSVLDARSPVLGVWLEARMG